MAHTVRSLTPEREVFAGGGRCGELLAAVDWHAHPLGPVEAWPQSLRTSLSLCLASRHPICIIWGPKRIYLYNDAYAPIVGGKHPRALGASYPEVWPEIWESSIRPILEKVESSGEASWSDDILLVLERHGFPEECYFSFSFAPVKSESGGVGGVFTAITETTTRVVGERRLRTLRDLGAHVPAGFSADDACRRARGIFAGNPFDLPFTRIYLYDAARGELRLAAASDVAAERVSLAEADPWGFAKVLGTGIPASGPLPAGTDAPRSGPWPEPVREAMVLPLSRAGQAEPFGVLVAGVSPRRPFDEDYRDFFTLVAAQLSGALANVRALEEERRRAEDLAELDRAKTAFFSNVSHEFRTPLTLLLGPLEDALREPRDPRDRARLETAQRNALRLLKLVNTLLDFSRIEAGRAQASYEPTDLAALTADLASGFRSAVETAGLRLVVDCPPLPRPVHVDRDMWEKIVLNLVSNAFKFTFEGEISVRLGWTGAAAELEVRDTGGGIPEDEIPRLFRRFHRVRSARSRSHEGSGIGLALVHELVRLHGGTVDVESALGRGSVFRVRVPAGTAHLPRERIAAERSAAPTALGARPFVEEALHWSPGELPPGEPPGADPTRRVLLADDNADMRAYVAGLLGRYWSVETAPDGAAALERMRACPPDLLLSDVMMPGLDGFQLLREIRSDGRLREIPVVLLSARAGEEAKVEGLEAGADDYLIKPFSARELLARVAAQLRLRALRSEAAREIRAANLRYELAMRATHELVWDYDLERGQAAWSGALEGIAGSPGAELRMSIDDATAWWSARLHPEDRSRVVASFERFLRGRAEQWRAEYRFKRGETFLHVVDRGVRGGPGRFVGSMLDISDQKRAEEALRRFNEELEAQVRRRTAQLEETLRELQTFSYTVAHDLRAPLRAMHRYAEALASEFEAVLPAEARDYASRVRESSFRMSVLIDDLLDYSRLGRTELRLAPVDVDGLMDELLRRLAPELEEVGGVIRVDRPLPRVDADRVLLEQALSNLLANAIKFTAPGRPARVKVRGTSEGGRVRLWVEDEGIGIDPRFHDRLFRVFERLTPGAYPGTGIGLAIVKRVAERLGGTVGVESAPGSGSRFWIELKAV